MVYTLRYRDLVFGEWPLMPLIYHIICRTMCREEMNATAFGNDDPKSMDSAQLYSYHVKCCTLISSSWFIFMIITIAIGWLLLIVLGVTMMIAFTAWYSLLCSLPEWGWCFHIRILTSATDRWMSVVRRDLLVGWRWAWRVSIICIPLTGMEV